MKREREFESITMANYLMLLSRGGNFEATYTSLSNDNYSNRVFECKTCNRQFPSFQALGGHRASHKKPRLMLGDDITHGGENNNNKNMMDSQLLLSSPQKPKTHECSICGLEFAIGQALGGHMRRHRAENLNGGKLNTNNNNNSTTITMSHSSNSGNSSSIDSSSKEGVKVARNNNKRVLVLDLNLTPFENDLEFLKIGKATALVDYL